jgi:glycosyltransferase involved in cell wall biosynthesis
VDVLVLTPYPYGKVAGPRSSFELWEGPLREHGIYLDYAVFESDRLHEILYDSGRVREKTEEMLRSYRRFVPDVLRRVRAYDAVLINREATLIGPALLERIVSLCGVPLIYVLDDPLYIPYRSPANGWLSYLKCFGKVKTLCRMSSLVFVNSPGAYAFTSRHNRNVWEVPSLVDGDVYTGRRPTGDGARNGDVCIGWSGSPTTAPNLRVIRDPLRAVSARPGVRLRFIGAREIPLDDVPYVTSEWRAETEVADLRSFDIGLLPVRRTPWSRDKFYLKLIQYMALGIPPVATPAGSYPSVIDHGITGFLAETVSDWLTSLCNLIEHSDLRAEIGTRAASAAHARYTLQANAEKILAAFRSLPRLT